MKSESGRSGLDGDNVECYSPRGEIYLKHVYSNLKNVEDPWNEMAYKQEIRQNTSLENKCL